MDGKSKNVKQEKIEKLKEIVPEIFTEGKIDRHQLNLTLGEVVVTEGERYVLNWAGKTEAFKVLQETTTATLVPAEKESVEFDRTGNIFIEGENLEVLKVLQKAYYGKIKMIYIDPPYNTGNDSFIYPDRFQESKDEYLKRIGDKDEEGLLTKEGLFRKNNKESGHFHSNWLSMMYPRLFLARNLLREDGVIFVSIDDNEVHNLRLLMNEIFGEENFLATIIWQKVYSPRMDAEGFSESHDYILVYGKTQQAKPNKILFQQDKEQFKFFDEKKKKYYRRRSWRKEGKGSLRSDAPSLYFYLNAPDGSKIYPIKPNGTESRWRGSKESFQKQTEEENVEWVQNEDTWEIYIKQYYEGESEMPSVTLWTHDEAGHNHEANDEVRNLLDGRIFDNPKPTRLIKKMLETGANKDSIILDFFAGSGSTAHAILNSNKEDGGNRKFICVQMPEKCEDDSEAFKAGYKTIAEICKERIRRVIKKIKSVIASETKQSRLKLDSHAELVSASRLDLGFKVFKLQPSNFKIWRSDIKEEDLPKQLDAFEKPVKPESQITNMIWEILLKSGYDLNTKVEEKKVTGCDVFSVADGELVLALSKISEKAIKEITKLKPKKFICLDSLFSGNDQLKTNTSLQLKDAGIDFKTI